MIVLSYFLFSSNNRPLRRIFLLLLSGKNETETNNSILTVRNTVLDAVIYVFGKLPKNAAEMYSNFGENWVDYRANLEGYHADRRRCLISGENQISLLRNALRLQFLVSLFDSILLPKKDNDDNMNRMVNVDSNGNSIGIRKNVENCNYDDNSRNCSNAEPLLIERTSLPRNLRTLAMICLRAIPLLGITVRTSLFFGAMNQR